MGGYLLKSAFECTQGPIFIVFCPLFCPLFYPLFLSCRFAAVFFTRLEKE